MTTSMATTLRAAHLLHANRILHYKKARAIRRGLFQTHNLKQEINKKPANL